MSAPTPGGPPPSPVNAANAPERTRVAESPIDVEALANKVYRLLLEDVRLYRARAAQQER